MPDFDINLLKEALIAVNNTTETLKASYDILQKKLEQTQGLLNSVLDNSNSAIIAVDTLQGVFLKNRKAKKLIEELGDDVFRMTSSFIVPGIHDYVHKRQFFRLSVGVLPEGSGFVYVIDDITDLKKLEDEKQRDEKLRLMGEMAANIAHEIRNPLGSIELYASLLMRDLDEDEDKKRLAASVIKGVRTINTVISNTLLFTKELKINVGCHILSDIVDEVVLYLQHLIRDKRVKFVNQLDENVKIYCDEAMFKQVVMNILGNAVDAVSLGGEIRATCKTDNQKTLLIIEDNGCGIEADMLKRLFMPFQTTKAKGTGLGLSISYKIMEAHGGNITAESNGKNWTRFTVTTPMLTSESM